MLLYPCLLLNCFFRNTDAAQTSLPLVNFLLLSLTCLLLNLNKATCRLVKFLLEMSQILMERSTIHLYLIGLPSWSTKAGLDVNITHEVKIQACKTHRKTNCLNNDL